MEVRYYSIYPEEKSIKCDGTDVGCASLAARVQKLGLKSFGILDWIHFYLIDFAHYFSLFTERRFQILSDFVDLVDDHQQKFLDLRYRVDEFAKKHFNIQANVDHLDQAEIICLGEIHTNTQHMIMNAEIIDALAEPKELVLVEHDERHKYRSNQAEYVKSDVRKLGWDRYDPEDIQKIVDARRLDLPKILNVVIGLDYPDWKKEQIREADQEMINALPARNQHMIQTIRSRWKPGKRVYVIAGSGHWMSPKYRFLSGVDLQPQEEMYELTMQFLRTKKFAILVPK